MMEGNDGSDVDMGKHVNMVNANVLCITYSYFVGKVWGGL